MKSNDKRKWKSAEVVRHIQDIVKIIEEQKEGNKLEHFTAITEDEIEQKFSKVNSPMIISQGWSDTTQGGTVNYNLGIYNPDPTQVIWLFAHVWVGSGNVDPTIGSFLSNVDSRFPRLTEPRFSGLSLNPGASTILNFSLAIPSTVHETNYIGNSCLMSFNWHDVGTYLDRGVFVFNVS
jgi:hypothetical protein